MTLVILLDTAHAPSTEAVTVMVSLERNTFRCSEEPSLHCTRVNPEGMVTTIESSSHAWYSVFISNGTGVDRLIVTLEMETQLFLISPRLTRTV